MKKTINLEVKKYYRDCGKELGESKSGTILSKIRGFPSWIYQSKRLADAAQILRQINLDEPVLDAACGSGFLLATLPVDSIGIDINPRHIKAAQINAAGRRAQVGDLEDLTFNNGNFGTVIVAELYEHIPDFRPSMKELWRVLKNGGKLVITVPSENPLWKVRFLASSMYKTEPQCVTFTEKSLDKFVDKFKYKKILTRKIAWGLNWIYVVEKK
jgi:SAM-dependent methyltransferase